LSLSRRLDKGHRKSSGELSKPANGHTSKWQNSDGSRPTSGSLPPLTLSLALSATFGIQQLHDPKVGIFPPIHGPVWHLLRNLFLNLTIFVLDSAILLLPAIARGLFLLLTPSVWHPEFSNWLILIVGMAAGALSLTNVASSCQSKTFTQKPTF
jgi:hypothetical protein